MMLIESQRIPATHLRDDCHRENTCVKSCLSNDRSCTCASSAAHACSHKHLHTDRDSGVSSYLVHHQLYLKSQRNEPCLHLERVLESHRSTRPLLHGWINTTENKTLSLTDTL